METPHSVRILLLSDESILPVLTRHLEGMKPVFVRPRTVDDACQRTSLIDMAILTYHYSEGGLAVCRRLFEADNHLPVIVISNSNTFFDIQAAFRAFAFDYLVLPLDRQSLIESVTAAYERRCYLVKRFEHLKNLPERVSVLEKENETMVEGFGDLCLWLMRTRSPQLEAHCLYLKRLCDKFLTFLEYDPRLIRTFRLAACFHDFGLIMQKESALKSPPANAQEMFVWKRHPTDSKHMIKKVINDELILDLIENHHELFNGSGFPKAMGGKRIPEHVRMFSFLNAFAGMVCPSMGEGRFPEEDAVLKLMENPDEIHDPDLVSHFSRFVSQVDLTKI